MFEFFEVPSQSIGAIGPVATGSNFDWLRQDIKPGQLNLNLIMDEEVFFSIAGKQTISQIERPGSSTTWATGSTATVRSVQPAAAEFQPDSGVAAREQPFSLLPAAEHTGEPVVDAAGGRATPPIPLVVTSTLANGTPATALPISTFGTSSGMAALDPISNYFFTRTTRARRRRNVTGPPWPNGNGLKAAWVQFLNLRHGGLGLHVRVRVGSGGPVFGERDAHAPARYRR